MTDYIGQHWINCDEMVWNFDNYTKKYGLKIWLLYSRE